MVLDEGGRDGVGVDDAGERHPAGGQLLDDARVGHGVEAESAVLLGDGAPEQTHALHALDEVVRVGVGVLQVGRDREDLLLDEGAHRGDQFVGQSRIGRHEAHRTSHAGSSWYRSGGVATTSVPRMCRA